VLRRLALGSLLAVVVSSVPPTPAADSTSPLDPIAWTAGHTWAAEIKTRDGAPMHVEVDFRWADHKKAITYDVRFQAKEKTHTQYSGMYFWHPGKKAIVLVEVTAQGATTEGVLKPEGSKLVQTNLHTNPDGTIQEQRVEIVRQGDDAFAFEAYVKDKGEWVKAVGFTYNRMK
jgi:hypothetical protein